MAACGSLQHIFENPLPESPTLLETLSSWNSIMAAKPAEQSSSFTEIFGELHFNESFVPDPPLTESNPLFAEADGADDNLWKEPFSNGESSSSFHRKSSSSSSTNSESLQLCTEGLGYESLDDVEDSKGGVDEQEWQREEEEEDEDEDEDEEEEEEEEEEEAESENLKKQIQNQNLKPGLMFRRSKSASMEDFPPPISCMGKSGKPWVGFKSYRYGGRFILKEVRLPTHEFLHASRENGRLKLHILVPNDHAEDQEDVIVDDNKNKKNNQRK